MTSRWSTTLFGAAVVLTVVAATVGACDDGPPGGPSGPKTTGLEITGPASVAPGQSAQCSVVQQLADGSVRPITDVAWTTTNPLLLRMDPTGLATAAAQRGEATIQAELRNPVPVGQQRVTREILVQPDGTFRIVGTVTETGAPGLALPGARLEARLTDDLSAPTVTDATTGADGRYSLYGVPRDAFIHVRLNGYRSTTTRVQLNAHETRPFTLELETPRTPLAGTYTMTVDAGGSCWRGGLPDNAKQRQYAATVTQDGPWLSVVLTEATFATVAGRVASRFLAQSTPSGIRLDLAYFYSGGFYYAASTPDVAELLPTGTVLVTSGSGVLAGTPSHLSGVLSGSMDLFQGSLSDRAFIGGCFSPRITWTRR